MGQTISYLSSIFNNQNQSINLTEIFPLDILKQFVLFSDITTYISLRRTSKQLKLFCDEKAIKLLFAKKYNHRIIKTFNDNYQRIKIIYHLKRYEYGLKISYRKFIVNDVPEYFFSIDNKYELGYIVTLYEWSSSLCINEILYFTNLELEYVFF